MSVAVKRSRIETRSTQPAAHPAAGPGTDPEADLGRLRDEMERIDAAVVEAVARRLEIARRIGEAKHTAGLPVLNPSREAAVVRRAVERARDAGVHDEGVRQLYWVLIDMARRTQLATGTDAATHGATGVGGNGLLGCAVEGASR